MPKPEETEPTVTLFCSNCGETKTYFASDAQAAPGKSCKECLVGTMVVANPHTPE